MITVRTTPEFDAWLSSIKDKVTRIRLARRLDRVQQGNFGDVKQVSESVFEMREHFGPGWRMYYARHVVIMLGGGDKSTQPTDIAKAMRRAATLEE
jgi:putative addiction module killer protein